MTGWHRTHMPEPAGRTALAGVTYCVSCCEVVAADSRGGVTGIGGTACIGPPRKGRPRRPVFPGENPFCDCGYQPVLTGGRLAKDRDPAWLMSEQTRDPGCVNERARAKAKVYGLGYQHHGDSRKSGAGYPDVHLWDHHGGRGSLYAELKTMDGRLSPDQILILGQLRAAGHRTDVWRPCCALSGRVDQVMAEFAGATARTRQPTPAPPPADRPVAQPVDEPSLGEQLAGWADVNLPEAFGFIVPISARSRDARTVERLEQWLRDCGVQPASVPYPIRLVVAGDALAVQVRREPTRRGERPCQVWWLTTAATPFPVDLDLAAAGADTITGDDPIEVSEKVADRRIRRSW